MGAMTVKRSFLLWVGICSHVFCLSAEPEKAKPETAELEKILKTNNAQEVDRLLKEIQKSGKSVFESDFFRGLIFLKREHYDSALASFSLVPVTSPYYLDARNNIAIIYAAQGKLTLAKSTLEDALKSNRSAEIVYKNLSDLKYFLANKSYSSALQILEVGKNSKPSLVVSTGGVLAKPDKSGTQLAEAPKSPAPEDVSRASTKAPVVASSKPETVIPPGPVALPKTEKQAPTVAPATAAKVSPANPGPDAVSAQAAIKALQEWASAWEKKDMENYLGAYAEDFQPPDGKTLAQWRQDRKNRILPKNRIKVQLSQIEAKQLTPTTVRLKFYQKYRSDQLEASSHKTVDMKLSNQRWLITRERTSANNR